MNKTIRGIPVSQWAGASLAGAVVAFVIEVTGALVVPGFSVVVVWIAIIVGIVVAARRARASDWQGIVLAAVLVIAILLVIGVGLELAVRH